MVLHAEEGKFESAFRKQVGVFLNALDEEQAKKCLLDVTDKRRHKKQYTGGKRPGISIGKLNEKQRAEMEKTVRMVLSDHGWKMANTVARQDKKGMNKYFITCFGDPRKGGDFAFRLAEHHLTIVHLEVAEGNTKEFGPILLGSNPPEIWLEDEALLMKAWKQGGTEKLLLEGSGIASKQMKAGQGMKFSDLKPEMQATLKEAWKLRISIFTKPIQQRLNGMHKERGGWEKSRVAYYGQPPHKRSKDGGRWDFKCGLPGMVWDYECSRGHIHMSLCVEK
ncbi:MAG: DUF3500 domain-containing protein [Akkermansiaceae bacterium]